LAEMAFRDLVSLRPANVVLTRPEKQNPQKIRGFVSSLTPPRRGPYSQGDLNPAPTPGESSDGDSQQ
jgi:hypothetical protein